MAKSGGCFFVIFGLFAIPASACHKKTQDIGTPAAKTAPDMCPARTCG